MPTNYPGSLDTLPRPSGSSPMNVAPYQGSVVIDNLSDAIEAIEAKLGISASVPAVGQVLRGTGAGASAFGQVQGADIANGTITTTQINDGTIAAVDIAAHAITQTGFSVGTTNDPNVGSSGSFATIQGDGTGGELRVTMTTPAGSELWALLVISTYNSAAGNANILALSLDGAAEVGQVNYIVTGVNYYNPSPGLYRWTGLSAGAHDVRARWRCTGGTMSANGVQRYLMVVNLIR